MKKYFVGATVIAALLIGAVYIESNSQPERSYYQDNDFKKMKTDATRIMLTNYPTHQQETEYSCGNAAALTVLNYFGNYDYDEKKLIELMNTKPTSGTSIVGMVKFFNGIGWKVRSSLSEPPIVNESDFKNFVAKNLSDGNPILVENVEYGGHWRVIIGLDTMGTENLYDDVLIFADPYDTSDHNQDGYTVGSLDRFFSMWFDHKVLPENERNQPWIIVDGGKNIG
ncbi:MAG: C39 family peptidase [Selenomonadaceae bacterium]|nr:C39 family peptidase [Selenomonadaceae bacterium]